MITVRYAGRACLFDESTVNRQVPGNIGRFLVDGHFYEEPFLNYIYSLDVRGSYVDAGSAIGTHALFFALMCRAEHVFAFEPRPKVAAMLRKNIEVNGVTGQVTAFEIALSDRDGQVEVTLDRHTHLLATRRLDDLVTSPVALLKIDVEGMETQVIDGAAKILARDCPLVFAEALGNSLAELEETMARHGYRPSGRVFNASPTYEFIPTEQRALSIGWTGPGPKREDDPRVRTPRTLRPAAGPPSSPTWWENVRSSPIARAASRAPGAKQTWRALRKINRSHTPPGR